MTRSRFSRRAMSRIGRASGLVLAALLATLAVPPDVVQGYRAAPCNGKIRRGVHENVTLKINRCQTPAANTAENAVITYGTAMWNRIMGVIDRFSTTGGSQSCAIDTDDNEMEIALVPNGHVLLEDLPGIESHHQSLVHEAVRRFGDGRLTKVDVVVDETLPLGSLGELDARLGARETMVHELGHVLGADHENELPSVLCTGTSCGKVGTRNVTGTSGLRGESFLPDDVSFAARYHSTSGGKIDPTVSPWWFDTVQEHMALLYPKPMRKTLCPGQTFAVRFSQGNLGKTNIPETTPIRLQVVFSPDTIIENSDEPGYSTTFWGTLGFFGTASRTVTVPDLDPGKYHVGVLMDPTNAKAEQDEYNNSTRLNVEITVKEGC